MAKAWNAIVTAGSETFGVGVGALAGLLIVHQLSKSSYAQYTFLTTCAAFGISLSDFGLTHCYIPVVGNRANDLNWVFGSCRHVYRLRWILLLPALLIVSIYWFHTSHGNAWIDPVYVFASIVAASYVALSAKEQLFRTLMIILVKVQKLASIGFQANVARLGLTALALWLVPVDMTVLALILATCLASCLSLYRYGKSEALRGSAKAALSVSEIDEVDHIVKRVMRPLLIPTLFYQVQGMISILLVALLANGAAIAEVGALSRPALILTVFDRILGVLLFPAIGRAPRGRELGQLILRSHFLYLSVLVVLFTSAFWAGPAWMLLIGERYGDQRHLLWMSFLAAILMNSSGFAFTTLSARGSTAGQSYLIPFVLIVQAAYIFRFGVSSTQSALGLSIATAGTFFLFEYGMLTTTFFNLSKESSI